MAYARRSRSIWTAWGVTREDFLWLYRRLDDFGFGLVTLFWFHYLLWKLGLFWSLWCLYFYFLCVVRHSCTYTKTTIFLIGSLYFLSFTEIKFHSSLLRLYIIWDNFGGQFTKNCGTQQKTNTTAMYINSILSIEVTLANITFQSRKQEDLNDPLLVRLSHTRENRSNSS